jgi:hypothetical protein
MNVTTEQVRKVMRASAVARGITTALLVMTVLAFFWVMYIVLGARASSTIRIGDASFPASALQHLPLKLWVAAFTIAITAFGFSFIYLLRRVFANLAVGEIFCEANVRHIRHLGLLLIAGGVFAWLVPLLNTAFFAMAGAGAALSGGATVVGAFGPFAYGALLILLSWIMAVGLGVRESADELRRDAELVI